MNNILYDLGGETSVTSYAIVGRMLMFAMFPVLGLTQGFLPIAGFNYGAQNYSRVRETIKTAIKFAMLLATFVFVLLMNFQAIGKAIPALFLTLLRQGLFFIPLILILPKYYGELGVWMSFPISDVLSTIVTAYFLNREIRKNLSQ